MNAFNRLPGFVPTPAGRERDVLRLLPRVLVFGTLLLALPSFAARIFLGEGDAVEASTRLQMVDILALGIVLLHWTAVLTVAIAAFIVMVMKGPAYVADAYPLEDSETPDSPDGPPADFVLKGRSPSVPGYGRMRWKSRPHGRR